MKEEQKLPEKLIEVCKHEGVVSITSWGVEPHVVNTWNSFLVITPDERILIPAYGFRKTEKNVNVNSSVLITLGTREVEGFKSYPGTGFVIEGRARFVDHGEEYDRMKEKFSFLTRVMEVTVIKATQKL